MIKKVNNSDFLYVTYDMLTRYVHRGKYHELLLNNEVSYTSFVNYFFYHFHQYGGKIKIFRYRQSLLNELKKNRIVNIHNNKVQVQNKSFVIINHDAFGNLTTFFRSTQRNYLHKIKYIFEGFYKNKGLIMVGNQIYNLYMIQNL